MLNTINFRFPKSFIKSTLLVIGLLEASFSLFAQQADFQKNNCSKGIYRNLFLLAGYSQMAIDQKVEKAWLNLFEGANKIYFEVDDSMAYVSDLENHDVQTEGLFYGVIAAVQLDKKEVFVRNWRWSKKYLQHRSGPRRGYFAWSYDPVNRKRNYEGSASDGELYYITNLLFASNRWRNNSGIDYYAEARTILDAMWEKDGSGNIYNLINTEHKQITFIPEGRAANFTDPSYHLPAFYEIRAQYANDGHEQFYHDCADTSCVFFHRACHPVTGLNSDYTNFDGSPHSPPWMPAGFRYDSWRVPMNIAMDYLEFVYKVQLLRCCSKSKSSYTLVYCGLNFSHALYLNFIIQTPDFMDRHYLWYGKDKKWQQEYALKFQQFLRSEGISTYKDQFNQDGSEPEFFLQAGGLRKLRHSLGLVLTAATASLILNDEASFDFVNELWNAKLQPYSDGYFDPYYDGLLYRFSLLHLSGKYQIITNHTINN